MITSLLMPNNPNNSTLRIADWVERKFHHTGLLDSWNRYVLINLVKR